MSTQGDALDQALGLLRAPSRRGALRARALPPGVTEVLSIAGGSEDSVRAAAARTGYGATELTEAARFFVQQVLLAEDADAYRVLGVAPDAGAAEIRDHHRLLMRWLHPDRGDDWGSALATRVNTAWGTLRSDAARSAYDDALARQPAQGDAGAHGLRHRVAVPGQGAGAGVTERGNRGAIAVATLALVCSGLAWLAIQRESRLDAERDESIAWQVPFARTAPSVDADELSETGAEIPEALRAARPVSPQAPTAPKRLAEDTGTDAVAPSAVPEAARDPTAAGGADPAGRTASTDTSVKSGPAVRPAHARQAGTAPPASPSAPVAAGRPASGRSDARDADADVMPAAPGTAIPEDTHDPAQLMRQARLAVDQAVDFLAAGAGPVAWQDAETERGAAQLRDTLHARLQANDRERSIRLQGADWRLDRQRASLNSRYRVSSGWQMLETGRLQVELQRRDARWWVASLRMEPGQ